MLKFSDSAISFLHSRSTLVPPKGEASARIAIIGEQPGVMEVRSNPPQPFVGPAGRELTACLTEAGLTRHECYFTNVIKDLDHELSYYFRRNPRGGNVTTSRSFNTYLEILSEELAGLKANVLVPVGNLALWALTEHWGITKWRGSVLRAQAFNGRKTIPIIHPATIIPPKMQYLNRWLIIADLGKVKAESTQPASGVTERKITIEPSYDETLEFLGRVARHGRSGEPVDYDIEVFNGEMSCICFTIGPREAISIPFLGSDGPYFLPDQELEVMLRIAEILEDRSITKRGQNLAFDCHFMLRKYGIRVRPVHDTMVAQGIIMPDYKKGLDFITSIFTDIPYYKDDGKEWFRYGGDWPQLWRYNALDGLATAAAHPGQMDMVRKQGNEATYDRQRSIIEPLTYMMERGIKCDVEGMRAESDAMVARFDELQEELNVIAGRVVNPNSPKQLQQYFYVEKGIKPYTKKGKITTDETAMKRLARRGFKEASVVLEMRRVKKLASVYLDVEKVDDDGRMRCSYNPVGTRYSRISSSTSIFGTGGNLQNWPHSMLRFLLADTGYVYYSIDLSQFENRIVAYVGRINEMIEAFETGVDVHSLTASLIFRKPIAEVTTEDGTCPLGDGTKSERFWGKKANHGLNYDLGYRAFALYYELPEAQAKGIVEAYHRAYPGVRQNYHAMVKAQLRKNRTLTNLMGRKTVFMNRWGDELFKEAYSCIPQGTCGDVINERGLNYVYYNQEQFKHVELLNQVHDSIGFQIPISAGFGYHAAALDAIKRSLETPLKTHYGQSFVIPCDITMGFNLCGECGKEIKHKKYPSTLSDLAQLLESNYHELLEAEQCQSAKTQIG